MDVGTGLANLLFSGFYFDILQPSTKSLSNPIYN
jgi:hypothetical protein